MDKTAGQKVTEEVAALFRSRCSLLWIVSPEEERVENGLIEAARLAKYDVRFWDSIRGVTNITREVISAEDRDPAAVLASVQGSTTRAVWVMRDFHKWIGDPTTQRALRNLARDLPLSPSTQARTVVVLTPVPDVPPELSDHAIVIRWPVPDRAEIAAVMDAQIEGLGERAKDALSPEHRDAAIEAAVGLTAAGAANVYTKSLVLSKGKIVPSIVSVEKKRAIAGKGIEWLDPDPRGLDAIGGLDLLKPWLLKRKLAFSPEARNFGLPPPKGVILVGVPGTGKSLTAKAIATAFECPLLRADLGATQSKWVGESQANIRAMFATAEAVGKCVLWFDEIEKALAGATAGAADGGVSTDQLGVMLSWMQDKTAPVFVIATSNDVSKLPPELLRKGRFDEMFFTDLPTAAERQEIIRVAIKKRGRSPELFNLEWLSRAASGFTGAEIDASVAEALFTAFADNRDLRSEDIVEALQATAPLSKTAGDKIEQLRAWAKGKARPASSSEKSSIGRGRELDL